MKSTESEDPKRHVKAGIYSAYCTVMSGHLIEFVNNERIVYVLNHAVMIINQISIQPITIIYYKCVLIAKFTYRIHYNNWH